MRHSAGRSSPRGGGQWPRLWCSTRRTSPCASCRCGAPSCSSWPRRRSSSSTVRAPCTVRPSCLPIPAVVRLARYVKVPYKPEVPLTRKGVLARDGHRCVYCGAAATSLDHVVPRSRGGPHVWENVVAACSRCNHAKADRSVADLGWRHAPAAAGAERCRLARARCAPSRPALVGLSDRDATGRRSGLSWGCGPCAY